MEEIKITVLGIPKPQPRHRHYTRGIYSGTYDPAKDDKASFAGCIQSFAPPTPFVGAIKLSLMFYFPRPKAHFGTGKNAAILKASAPQYCTKKPDFDNCIKYLCDTMTGVFYKDDAQVVECFCTKRWSDKPRTVIHLKELDDD